MILNQPFSLTKIILADSWKNLEQNPGSSCFILILTAHRTQIPDPDVFWLRSFQDNTNSDLESDINYSYQETWRSCTDP